MFSFPGRNRFRLFPMLLLLIAIAACGGGGGGDSTPVAPSNSTPNPMPTAPSDANAPVTLAESTLVQDGARQGAPYWLDGDHPDGAHGQPVGALACAQPGASHTYAHVSIFLDGHQLALPAGIGVIGPTLAAPKGCVYGLHTDDASGKVRFDASAGMPFTLGQLFALWGQPLTAADIAGLTGLPLAIHINDGGVLTAYSGDPAAIVLLPHREITIQLGSPLSKIPTYHWSDPPPLSASPIVLAGKPVGAPHWPDGDGAAGGLGQPVNGIVCGNIEENYHVHAHLAIVKDGQMLALPGQIGITPACNYEMHTHDATGEIHIETAAIKPMTLGQFFAIWGQPLSSSNVAGFSGQPVTVYVNDGGDVRRFDGDPGALELVSHRSVTLQIGAPLAEIPSYVWDLPE